jgi:alpha-beta hydrolase superfamily lysophospholipase
MQIAPEHEADDTVEHVVFVVHGIRDHGYWTGRLARRIQRVARQQGTKCVAITSRYGYFPMWPFIFSYIMRQRNVRWFMDQYTAAIAKYPNARVSFLGHSNGTYLLANALRHYPCCRFERAIFAGSVVRTTFPWDQMIAEGRIKQVRNVVAASDGSPQYLPAFTSNWEFPTSVGRAARASKPLFR